MMVGAVFSVILLSFEVLLSSAAVYFFVRRRPYPPFVGSGRPLIAYTLANTFVAMNAFAGLLRVVGFSFSSTPMDKNCHLPLLSWLFLSMSIICFSVAYGRCFFKGEYSSYMARILVCTNTTIGLNQNTRAPPAKDARGFRNSHTSAPRRPVNQIKELQSLAKRASSNASGRRANVLLAGTSAVHCIINCVCILVDGTSLREDSKYSENGRCHEDWGLVTLYNATVWCLGLLYAYWFSVKAWLFQFDDAYGVQREWKLALIVTVVGSAVYIILATFDMPDQDPWFWATQWRAGSSFMIQAIVVWWPILRSYGFLSFLRQLPEPLRKDGGPTAMSLRGSNLDKETMDDRVRRFILRTISRLFKNKRSSPLWHTVSVSELADEPSTSVVQVAPKNRSSARVISVSRMRSLGSRSVSTSLSNKDEGSEATLNRLRYYVDLYRFLSEARADRLKAYLESHGSTSMVNETILEEARPQLNKRYSIPENVSVFELQPARLTASERSSSTSLFEVLIAPPRAFKLFTEHLRKEFSLENLLFLQAVARIRSLAFSATPSPAILSPTHSVVGRLESEEGSFSRKMSYGKESTSTGKESNGTNSPLSGSGGHTTVQSHSMRSISFQQEKFVSPVDPTALENQAKVSGETKVIDLENPLPEVSTEALKKKSAPPSSLRVKRVHPKSKRGQKKVFPASEGTMKTPRMAREHSGASSISEEDHHIVIEPVRSPDSGNQSPANGFNAHPHNSQKSRTNVVRCLRTHIKPTDHFFRMNTYKRCFYGQEIVDVLKEQGIAQSDDMAILIGDDLVKGNFINAVTGEYQFQLSRLFRFMADEEATPFSEDFAEKLLPSKDAYDVWMTYLKPGCLFEVNVSDGVRNGVRVLFESSRARRRRQKGITDVPVWAFDTAAKEIYRLVSVDSLQRFLDTDGYKTFLSIRDQEVMKALRKNRGGP